MSAAIGTKEKRAVVGRHYPPKEIGAMPYGKAQTQARRAWLAGKVDEIKAQPSRDAKIVGTGSYQHVVEYSVDIVEGRVRLRGVCQVCGGAQVVENGVMVLHGYKRPGDGYTVGRCPGVRRKPLNVDKTITEELARQTANTHAELVVELAAAKDAEKHAGDALYRGANFERIEPDAYKSEPREPDAWNTRGLSRIEADAKRAEYRAARADWAKRFPLTATYETAKRAASNAQQAEYHARCAMAFYRDLLARNIYGTPCATEVVA